MIDELGCLIEVILVLYSLFKWLGRLSSIDDDEKERRASRTWIVFAVTGIVALIVGIVIRFELI